jgi:nickel/cobalt transporter (NicO) family protein
MMMCRHWDRFKPIVLSLVVVLLVMGLAAPPVEAHWADLAVAEVTIGDREVQMTLTFPTDLVAETDRDRNGQLSVAEVEAGQSKLQEILEQKIQLLDVEKRPGRLQIFPLSTATLPSATGKTSDHSTLNLQYRWPTPITGIQIHYDFFVPGFPNARCVTTVFGPEGLNNVILSPNNQTQWLFGQPKSAHFPWASGFWITMIGAFFWGALHALSPGHGKTIVGAYLTGNRATAHHALFLGLVTTVTHTLGVFALGLFALFASKTVLPAQVFPWLSLVSGVIVVCVGGSLLRDRLRHRQWQLRRVSSNHLDSGQPHSIGHHYDHGYHHRPEHGKGDSHDALHTHAHRPDHHHTHSHSHSHLIYSPDSSDHHHAHPEAKHHHCGHAPRDDADVHDHDHDHVHDHGHSHLPPGADGKPVTFRSLLALGISGGLIPCPSALVLLLSSVSLGQVGYGLILVLAFSLGLAGVLTGLGLLLVYGRQWFTRLPKQVKFANTLPTLSAIAIALIGCGMTIKAIVELG